MSHDTLVHICMALAPMSALTASVFQSSPDFVMRGLVAASPV